MKPTQKGALFVSTNYICPSFIMTYRLMHSISNPRKLPALASDPVWFTRQVLGVNTLAKIVSTICTNGGLTGHRTNHSLRATAATRMYDLEFDEQLVCETTGHRSHCVRSYKRTSSELKRKASRAVQGIKRKYQRASQSSQAGASAKSGKQRAAPCATVSMPPQVFNMYFQFGTD